MPSSSDPPAGPLLVRKGAITTVHLYPAAHSVKEEAVYKVELAAAHLRISEIL